MSKRELEPDIDYQKAFGNHLRRLREQVGWTQIDLSIHSGVSEYQISIIENGHQGPNLQTIKAIAVALGKHPMQLLDFKYDLKLNTNFPKQRDPRTPTTKILHLLVAENFFKQPKSVKDVTAYCNERFSVTLRSASTSGALLVLVSKKKLKITKSKERKNLYQNLKNR